MRAVAFQKHNILFQKVNIYYMQLAKVLNPTGVSTHLSSKQANKFINPWQDISELKCFVCAFPRDSNRKHQVVK